MDIVKVVATALITCFLAILIKQYKPEYGMAVAICGGAIIFLFVAPSLAALLQRAGQFAARVGIEDRYLSPVFKTLGIAYITQYSAEMCRDAGEGALASKLEMAGKIIMLAIALPVAGALFETVERILP